MEGWIKLYRQISENKFWTCEPFSRGQAWIDLLLLANHDYGFFYCREHKVEVQRGQVGWSEMKLAKRWQWSRSKVSRFLKDLEKEHQIVQQKSKSYSTIQILNYDKFQEKKQQQDIRKTSEKQQQDTNKNENNEKNEKKKREVRPTFEEVKEYCSERGNKVNPQKWYDHYTSNGWRVGKNPMKDWKASVRKWEINNQNFENHDDNKKDSRGTAIGNPRSNSPSFNYAADWND